MPSPSLIRRLLTSPVRAPKPTTIRRVGWRLGVETLEDRTVPSAAIAGPQPPSLPTTFPAPAPAVTHAENYLRTHAATLGLDSPTLADLTPVFSRATSYGGTVERFQQKFDGIPVYHADIVVTMLGDGTVTYVTNSYESGLELPDTVPAIGAAAARATALAHLGVAGPFNFDSNNLVVFPGPDGARLAYQVTVVPKTGAGDFEVLVDADTGAVLQSRDLADYDTGTGNVFGPDPISSSGASYGDPGFTDNNNADSPQLTAQLKSVTLPDITNNAGTYSLVGPYAQIVDSEAPFTGLYTQSSPTFAFTRSSDAFEAVNGYYHLDRFLRYLNETLGESITPLQYAGGVKFDPHGLSGGLNAHYTPSTGELAFGDGDADFPGSVDMAEDASVMVHELGHGIHDWVTGGNLSQVDGLSEGVGDYFAQSYCRAYGLFNPGDPAFDVMGHWGGYPAFTGRTTNYDPIPGPDYPGGLVGFDPHIDGQIWSTANMKIWNLLGQTATDRVMVEGLAMTDSKTSQEGAAQALLQAAANLGYPQSDVHAMYQIYVATGYSVTEPTVTTSVTLTAALDAGGNLTVTDKDGSKDNNLTVSVTGGNLTIADAHEQFESAPAGWTLAPTGRAISIPVASFTKSITLNTAGGNDTVTVSFAGGSPLAGGLSYDGGTGSDKLWAKGSGTQNATYTPDATTTGDGKVVVEGKTITFAGLEPVNVSGMATATVQLPGADDVLTLSQGNSDVSAGQPTLLVSGTSAGTTIENVNLFKNTTVVVDTAAGGADGNDTVNIARVENDHGNTNLTVNTGSGKGDRVHVIGTVTFAGKTTLNSPRVDLDADVTGTVAVPRGLTLTGAGSDRVSVGGLDLTNLTGTLTVTGLRVTGATALAGTNVGGSTTLTDVVLSAAGVGAVAFAPGSSLTVNTGAGADTVGVAPGSKTTAVTWNGGQSVAVSGLGTLTLNGGDGGDTFNVGMPPAGQIGKLNLNGEAPDVAPGDTLNLSLAGTVNPTYSGTASGTAAATGFAAVAWAGIEAFPVPAGLGGTFDFQPDDPAHSVQPGSTMVTPSTAYTAAQGYGWTQAPRYGYDGGSQNVLSGSPLAGLLQDGVLGFSGMSSAAVFRVDVVSNNPFQIAAYLGDVLGARDKIEVAYSTNGDAASPTYTPITPAGGLSLPQGQFTAVSSATLFPGGVVPGVAGKALSVWVRIAELGGTPPGWTLSGLDVRPRTPVADLAVTPPATSTLPADSAVVDTFQVTGAPPGAVLTVATSLGAVESADARPELVGSQVIAGADGTAVVGIRRPSAGGTANVTVTEFAGGGSGSASQDYAVSLVQTGAGARVRSGTLSGPDADTFDRASVAFDQDVRVSTFTADDVVITLPDGTTLDNASANLQVSVAAAGATAGNARVFTVTFAGQTAVGTYTVKIGPNILNVDGNPMDQDGDGTAGETNGNDTFVATQHLPATDPSGAKVIAGAAVGSGGGSLDKLTVTFDRAVDPATFTPNDVVITGPGGTIAATQVAPADASNTVFDVAFPEQSAVGAYTFVVGPQILDATSGQPMNQNGNNANGEIPDDQFTLPTSIGDSGGPTGPGPTITAVSYPRDTPDVLDEIRVTFSEPLLESTLTSDDLRLTGPGGAAIDVSGATVAVVPDAPNTYLYTLATPLTVLGTYQVVIGPNVTDQDRVGMAQAFEGTVRVRQKSVLAVGGSDGSLSVVDPTNGDVLVRGRPLDGPNGVKYTGIVSQAIGDINGDSLADLLVAAASPLGENGVTEAIAGKIFVFDGADLANVRDGRLPAPSETLVPFATTDSIDPATGQRVTTGAYANGLNIALGDVNGDGSLDILVGTRGGVMDAAATAAGAPAAVGKFEIGRLAVLDGETGARIGADVFPFSDAYTKGVVPTAADLDGDGGQEVLVTRGGPVATEGLSPARARAKAAIKVQGYDLVNGQWQNLNLGANLRPTAGDGADFAWAPFDDLGPGVDPSTPVIARDGRLAAVGLPGGKQGVVFTAEADPNQATDFDSNIYGLTFTSTIGGQVTILSTGANGPTSGAYLISSAANDHATSSVDVDADGAGDVAVALETVMPQIVLLDPLTGQQRSTFAFPVTPNGVTLYGY